MMEWLAAVAGVLLIITAMVDAVWTTLTTGGGGPLTARLSEVLWRSVGLVKGGLSLRQHRLLVGLGTFMLLMIMVFWIILLWAGWTLLFSADPNSVVNATTREPADLSSLIYFTGYTLFTLGVGNFVPNGDAWEIVTAVASLNGLTLISLSITYLVPVVSAAAEKRQLSAAIYGLGDTPQTILKRGWSGAEFKELSNHLSQLVPMILMHAQRHAAYPILHYFHSPHRSTAASPNLAALDEALLIMATAVDPEVRLPDAAIEPLRSALDGLMNILNRQYVHSDADAPPIPNLEPLREAGIPLVSDAELRRAAAKREKHRRVLHAFVQGDGWSWDDVMSGTDSARDATILTGDGRATSS